MGRGDSEASRPSHSRSLEQGAEEESFLIQINVSKTVTLIKNHIEMWTFESSTETETRAKCEEWNNRKNKGGPISRKHTDVSEKPHCRLRPREHGLSGRGIQCSRFF